MGTKWLLFAGGVSMRLNPGALPAIAMTRRRKLILAVGIFAVAVVAVPLGLHVWRQRFAPGRFIDQEHCARIKKGMTQEEVEAIFGVPPGKYTKKDIDVWVFRIRRPAGERLERWTGDEGVAKVTFDEQGAVVSSTFEKGWEYSGPTVMEQIRAWLRPPATIRGTFKSAPTPWTHPETPPSAP
jgi:outer membrane protein assembly factor BamE (lipoprotein component of BamABCDE complex)